MNLIAVILLMILITTTGLTYFAIKSAFPIIKKNNITMKEELVEEVIHSSINALVFAISLIIGFIVTIIVSKFMPYIP